MLQGRCGVEEDAMNLVLAEQREGGRELAVLHRVPELGGVFFRHGHNSFRRAIPYEVCLACIRPGRFQAKLEIVPLSRC